jgi:hypothetical protein
MHGRGVQGEPATKSRVALEISPPRLYAPEPLEGFISRTIYAALTHLS